MSHQYIHTSAKRGLEPGKSGFCCVARDRSTPLDLILELERLSRYESVSGAISPIILRYEVCALRSGTYHILSRIQDSGVDYSKRNNHIAQHLAFLPHEIPYLPDPMTILLCWKGWKQSWNELPRILELEDAFDINEIDTKNVITNHPDEFPDLIVNGLSWKRTLEIGVGEELAAAAWIRLHLLHVPNEKKWQFPFSTYLLTTDNPDTFTWSCIWKGRELPYEVDTTGTPWDEPEVEDSEEGDPPRQNTQKTLQNLRKPNTPIIEIPRELTRRDRKKPKTRWTKSRFNVTMNLTLIAGTLICLGIASYQFLSLKEPTEKLRIAAERQKITPEEKAAQEENERRQLKAQATQEWLQLQSQRLLIERKDEATLLANTLADLGNTDPRETLHFINEAVRRSNSQPYPATPELHINYEYIKKLPARVELTPEIGHYLSQLTLNLLPHGLLDTLQKLEELSISSAPIKERLTPITFIPEDISIAIKEIRRKSRDSAITKDLIAWNAIIAFNERKEEIKKLKEQQALLKIHEVFQLDDRDRFIPYNEDGLLTTPELLSFDRYLMSLFEKYMLPRYTKFETSPEFTSALNNLTPDKTIRLSIYDVLKTAKPIDPQTQTEWKTITRKWEDLLIKNDLMQETLTNYAIEQLEENKASLAKSQNSFTQSQYQSFKRLQAINTLLSELETEIANVISNQEWVVIPQEPIKEPQLTTLQ